MVLKHKDSFSVAKLVVPIKALGHRLSFVFAIFLSFIIILLGRLDYAPLVTLRNQTVEMASPLLVALSSPVQAYDDIVASIEHMLFIYDENIQLRQENQRLKQLKPVAIELEAENRRLRELLKFIPSSEVSYITAQVVGETGGTFNRSAIISTPHPEGIQKGQMVKNTKGLVGRIVDVSERSARILLLTDMNSRVPVMTGLSRERAILTGNNTETPLLNHLPADTNIRVGESVVTSGDGGMFPAGVPVGTVTRITKDNVYVKPFADWSRLEYVSIAQN